MVNTRKMRKKENKTKKNNKKMSIKPKKSWRKDTFLKIIQNLDQI